MSQKEENKAGDKWRDIAEQVDSEPLKAQAVTTDDEHLLSDESSSKKLLDHVNLLEKQVESLKDQAARAQAEAENTRRRMEQEVTKARKFGVERLISELVPVVESLSRALENLPSDDHSKLTRQGIELTLDMLHKLLEKNGIVSIEPKAGDAFDPTQHEAMAMQPHPDGKSNAVIQVLQKGYALHGRVIKAAMVIVS